MKYIIDEVKLKVPKNDQKMMLDLLKELKQHLELHNMLPHKYEVFHDIDKEPEIFIVYLGFESDPHYDEWELKYKKLPETEFFDKIKPYLLGYNYLEKIDL